MHELRMIGNEMGLFCRFICVFCTLDFVDEQLFVYFDKDTYPRRTFSFSKMVNVPKINVVP